MSATKHVTSDCKMIHHFRLTTSPQHTSLTFSLFFTFTTPIFTADTDNQTTVSQTTHQTEIHQTWKILNYLTIDYENTITNDQITSEPKFTKMTEFTTTAQEKIQTLPTHSSKDDLLTQAAQLQTAIAAHRDPA